MENILGRIFTIDECNEIIKSTLFREDWKHQKWIGDKEWDSSFDYYIIDYNDNQLVTDKFKNLINSKFSINVNVVNIFILKYLPGGMFGRHFDRTEFKEFNKDFVYNINVLLNDSFEGGEFYLKDSVFEGNTPGIAYHYQSTDWHEVKPVKSGVRYSMLCYVRERDFVVKNKKSVI